MYLEIDYNQMAEEYSALREACPRVVSHIADVIGEMNLRKYLDAGCGTGDYLYALKEVLKGQGLGFDSSPAMIVEGKKKNPGIEIKAGRADERFPFDDSCFDFLYSVNFIHYIKDLVGFFVESYRVLDKGGIMLSVTDSTDDIRKRTAAVYFPETVDADIKRYPPIEVIKRAMKSAGFRRIRLTHTEYPFTITREYLESCRQKVFSTLRLIPQDAFLRGMSRLEADISDGTARGIEVFTYVWGMK